MIYNDILLYHNIFKIQTEVKQRSRTEAHFEMCIVKWERFVPKFAQLNKLISAAATAADKTTIKHRTTTTTTTTNK